MTAQSAVDAAQHKPRLKRLPSRAESEESEGADTEGRERAETHKEVVVVASWLGRVQKRGSPRVLERVPALQAAPH